MRPLKILAMSLAMITLTFGAFSWAEDPAFEIKLTDSITITATDVSDVLIEYSEGDDVPYILIVLTQEAKERLLRGNVQIRGEFTQNEALKLADDIQASVFGENSKYDDD